MDNSNLVDSLKTHNLKNILKRQRKYIHYILFKYIISKLISSRITLKNLFQKIQAQYIWLATHH